MAIVRSDSLATLILRALHDGNTPLWHPALTADLTAIAWQDLDRRFGLTPATYATTRVVRRDVSAVPCIATTLPVASRNGTRPEPVNVEVLPDQVASAYVDSNRLLSLAEINDDVINCVKAALAILSLVPDVVVTVSSLVRALHLVDSGDDQIDVSFSEPQLPFSAFVSVPGPGAKAGALRVAEALLHEAMHLQLTLVERVVPLVQPTGSTFFSPWRNEFRTAQGVLHALYVFRAIDDFFERVSLAPSLDGLGRLHIDERRTTITSQVREIHAFSKCTDLTRSGAVLVGRLLQC